MALLNNIKAYWKLEDLTEAIGAITDLTNNNVATFTAGKIANALTVVRANTQYLSHTDATPLKLGTGDYSFVVWVNLASKPGADMMILSKGDNTVVIEYELYHNGAGGQDRFIAVTNSQAVIATNFGAPTLSTWYFIACTWTESTKTNTISVNNGAVNSTVQASGSVATTNDLNVGALFSNPSIVTPWDGQIDELGLWNRVLTAGEITQLWNNGNGLTYPFFDSAAFIFQST